jgi:hypothetical protein
MASFGQVGGIFLGGIDWVERGRGWNSGGWNSRRFCWVVRKGFFSGWGVLEFEAVGWAGVVGLGKGSWISGRLGCLGVLD